MMRYHVDKLSVPHPRLQTPWQVHCVHPIPLILRDAWAHHPNHRTPIWLTASRAEIITITMT